MNKTRIYTQAVIDRIDKGGRFLAHLEDMPHHKLMLTVAGRLQRGRIYVVRGDTVNVELSPYDLTRGRITWRH